MNRERELEKIRNAILNPRKRIRFVRGTNGSMRIPMRKKFTPTKIEDQIKEIIFLRDTGMPIKDIAELLDVAVEMARDVLKNKRLYQLSADNK